MEALDLIAGCVDGRWQPRFVDPDLRRWGLTAGYAVAGILCLALAIRAAPPERAMGRVLLVLGVAMCAIGLNKQLNLQTLVRAIGHCEANRAGWYAERETIRQPVAAVVIVALALSAAWFTFRLRRIVAPLADMLGGAALVLGYLALRIGLWNQTAAWMRRDPLTALLVPLAEPAGIALVTLGALVRLAIWPRRGPRLSGRGPPPPG